MAQVWRSSGAGTSKRLQIRSCDCAEQTQIIVSRRRRRPRTCSVSIVFAMIATSLRCHQISAWTSKRPFAPNTFTSKREAPLVMATNSRELRFLGGPLLQDTHPDILTRASSSSSSSSSSSFSSSCLDPSTHTGQSMLYHTSSYSGLYGVPPSSWSFQTKRESTDKKGQSGRGAAPGMVNPSGDEPPLRPAREGFGPSIRLSDEERQLFSLLMRVQEDTNLDTTLRVAGGWVRDKLLATPEFQVFHTVWEVGGERLTSKFRKPAPSMGRQGTKVLINTGKIHQPVDIDIALDDMLGREFADHLNDYLTSKGQDTVSVGVVLKNPEKSKHLETATMKVGNFWLDCVNLRAEAYSQTGSRIPDLMRIGTPAEDAYRRDLTINSLFYNVNTGQVEDWTGRGFDDLRKGIVATPLPPLTTLLDDPLRVLRSVRFAARLRFTMDTDLVEAATDVRVRTALEQKVSRERVGGEVDLMLRSPDPVGAMRLLNNLKLIDTVFPITKYLTHEENSDSSTVFKNGLDLLSATHDHMVDCRLSPPIWCVHRKPVFGATEVRLTEDSEARRILWYASFLKPFYDECKKQAKTDVPKKGRNKKSNRSDIFRLLVEDLKRPIRDAEAIERVLKAADDFSQLVKAGCDFSAVMILLSDVRVSYQTNQDGAMSSQGELICTMNGRKVDSSNEEDPVWEHAMEFRLLCSKVMQRVGPLWRAALSLAISEELAPLQKELEYVIEGDCIDESQEERREGVIERFDSFATALHQIGLVGIWEQKVVLDGERVLSVLPNLPKGPKFRDVMDEQMNWMTLHPGASSEALESHLRECFADFVPN